MELQDTLNQLSRRKWLRDAALAATSIAVAPSMLTSCTDHRIPPDGGLGSSEDLDLYKNAKQNLINMKSFYETLYSRNRQYAIDMYLQIKGGKEPPTDWQNILIDVFVKIGVALLEIALEEIPFAGAAIGIAYEEIDKWENDKRGVDHNVETTIGTFLENMKDQFERVDNKLIDLTPNPDNDYKAIRELFKDGKVIHFKQVPYSLNDLGKKDAFPGDYSKALTAAEIKFKKSFWESIIKEAGQMVGYGLGAWEARTYGDDGTAYATALAKLYSINESRNSYIRGYYGTADLYHYYRWVFEFDGKEISDEVAAILFKDDAVGHIINQDAFFFRDEVHKQLHAKKPEFFVNSGGIQYTYYDMADPKVHGFHYKDDSFLPYDWNFDFKGYINK
ncbi:hypothetical protein [Spirosoma pulveris]